MIPETAVSLVQVLLTTSKDSRKKESLLHRCTLRRKPEAGEDSEMQDLTEEAKGDEGESVEMTEEQASGDDDDSSEGDEEEEN